MYTIIEDCSPFYIRFKWEGIEELINFIATQPTYLNAGNKRTGYVHYNFDLATANQILDQLPLPIKINNNRVGLFITPPGGKSSIHKDGKSTRYSINITIKIPDDKCITNWYSDESLKDFKKENDDYSRIVVNHNIKPTPIKTMSAVANECILFNTDIYHSWDNTNSANQRIVLTMRDIDVETVSYDEAKQILFDK